MFSASLRAGTMIDTSGRSGPSRGATSSSRGRLRTMSGSTIAIASHGSAATRSRSVNGEAWRGEFPILARTNYLNSCSLGALSRRAEARIAQFHTEWHTLGASAWYEIWLGRLAELRGRVARMLNATEQEIGLAASV